MSQILSSMINNHLVYWGVSFNVRNFYIGLVNLINFDCYCKYYCVYF